MLKYGKNCVGGGGSGYIDRIITTVVNSSE